MTPTAPIVDVQRFCLHDGPGIRSLVFLKGCALHCPWCQNPESQDRHPVVAFYRERCGKSFECERACPEDAIRRDGLRIDHVRCTACGLCIDVCAYDALRLIGEEHTPEQLLAKILTDRVYYETSGGGVTFSGGEPTLYPQFIDAMLDLCIADSIHTNLETAGTFSFELWKPILRKLDLMYFDLKILDEALHARHVGRGYPTIARNAALLVEHGFPVEFRLPLIPGYTDTRANIERAIELLERLGGLGVHLLAYHNMGEAKIDIIQGRQPKLGLARYSEEKLQAVRVTFEDRGIAVLNHEPCGQEPMCEIADRGHEVAG
jgi:pyruvate formate lyase activating enzyme